MKLTKSHLLSIVFTLFTVLYTIYIEQHVRPGAHKGDDWWYYLRFILVDGYLFFIFQYAMLRKGDRFLVALLPIIILVASVLITLAGIWIISFGGGDLFTSDMASMILLTVTYIGLSIFSLRYLR